MSLRDGLRQNLGLKALSLALALLLWSFVHGSKIVDREIWLPVRVVNLPDSLVLVSEPPREAHVLVSGPTQEMALRLRLVPNSELRVDLSHARAPVHHVNPTVSDIVLPSNSRITAVRILEPTAFDLRLERRLERRLAVQPTLVGEPAAGYCFQAAPRVEPPVVRCWGPESAVSGLTHVATRRVDVARKRSSFTQRVDLIEPARASCEPSQVEVRVEVSRLRTRSLTVAPRALISPAGPELAIDVRPPRASVTLSGPQPDVDALDPEQVALVVDVRTLHPGRYDRVPLVARLPPWARLDSLAPSTVDVIIQRRGRR
jgi:YbbR domain-containing protein